MSKGHLDQPAVRLNLPSPSGEKVGILAFHGRNQDPQFMVALLSRLKWENRPTIIPEAMDKSWYPGGFMAPLATNEKKLQEALDTVSKYHQELNDSGFADDQMVLLGFSQGACLVAQYCLLYPKKYKAIVILTGGYIGPEGVNWKFTGDFEGTPTFISTSAIDEWVPPGRAQETAAQYEKMNAEVTFKLFKDREHLVSEEEIQMVQKLVK